MLAQPSVLTVPATDIAEETVISEEPTMKRQRIEVLENITVCQEIEVKQHPMPPPVSYETSASMCGVFV